MSHMLPPTARPLFAQTKEPSHNSNPDRFRWLGRRSLKLMAVLMPLFVGGCVSPGFQKAWNEPSRCTANKQVAQRWEGHWESTRRPGVGGKLRALIEPEADGHVRAYFEARWKCFVTAYKVSLDAKTRRGVTALTGQQNIDSCAGGGLYTYKGTLTPHEFRAGYDSHHDTGVFILEPSAVIHPPCSQ